MVFSIFRSLRGGTVSLPKSQSEACAFAVAAALADKKTRTEVLELGEDAEAVFSCVRELGALIEQRSGFLEITPYVSELPPMLSCKGSVPALCYMMAVGGALGKTGRFTADPALQKKQMIPFYKLLCGHGLLISSPKFPIFSGKSLSAGSYEASEGVPSAGLNGLLAALPLLPGDSTLTLRELDCETEATVSILNKFGAEILRHGNTFYIKGGTRYMSPGVCSLRGDEITAAAWLCLGALSPEGIRVLQADLNTMPGGRGLKRALTDFGALLSEGTGSLFVRGRDRRAFAVNCGKLAPYLPFLAVLASVGKGVSRFSGLKGLSADRLRSLKATAVMLGSLGAAVRLTSETLEISGVPVLRGGAVTAYGEPSAAMAATIAAQVVCSGGEVLLNGAEAVNKHYPMFFREYRRIGGELYARIQTP